MQQIRMVSNGVRLAVFANGWRKEHDLSLPLTGAVFDIWVDIFHESLLDRQLIGPQVEDLADQVERVPEYQGLIQSLFDRAYALTRSPSNRRFWKPETTWAARLPIPGGNCRLTISTMRTSQQRFSRLTAC